MTKLIYFAWVRERIGKSDEDVAPPANVVTIGELMDWLAGRGEEYAYAFENRKVIRAAIDRNHVQPGTAIAGAGLNPAPLDIAGAGLSPAVPDIAGGAGSDAARVGAAPAVASAIASGLR